jgi:CheY-like chemotaxis protein
MANERGVVRVLLIEDHPPDVFLVKEALKTSGIACELTHVKDGQEARAHLENAASASVVPHLIFLDLNVPKMEGLELLKIIRGQPRFAEVPVAVLTSSRDQSDQDRAHRLGANVYITKPVDFLEFLRVVGSAAQQLLPGSGSPT